MDKETKTIYNFYYATQSEWSSSDDENWMQLLNSIQAPTIMRQALLDTSLQTEEEVINESSTTTTDASIYEALQKGDKGEKVLRLQEALITLGYLDDTADGNFGPKTEKAVEAYQKAKGLQITKIADHPTLSSIYSDEAALHGNIQEKADEIISNATPVPTPEPTAEPMEEPTPEPTEEPTSTPTAEPTAVPTEEPTPAPTVEPTAVPQQKEDVLSDYSKSDVLLLNEEIRINQDDSFGLKDVFYVAELKNNTNEPYSVYGMSLDLEDSNSSLVLTRSMISVYPDIIMPGCSGYIHEKVSGFFGDEEFDPQVIVKPILHYKTKPKAGYEYPDVSISDIIVGSDEVFRDVSCRIQNNTDEDLTGLTIVALLFDDDGKFLTYAESLFESIEAHDKKGFKLMELYTDDSVQFPGANVKIYVY